ncbi:hypothetical protein RFI_36589 [Reticulomyxa filosa]|uniref:Uncharacterized protein n=1 Tax=Reticulomyxa filosa TaxID=46433 RepID=X6LFU5_RETFI|nr:hypothetical protein RFI_36589 [Reticulomyxa filosa]|eukprot:ETO00853.1 hypothetical protein RFI_36589 [Reticulomyxa filosa]
MAKVNTMPKSTEEKQDITESTILANSSTFRHLNNLPFRLYQPQCISYKYEIIICGGPFQNGCYSYNTLKQEYKHICNYPVNIQLKGHCVMKLVENKDDNTIILLSFGGVSKHTLVMKYISIWNDNNAMKESIKYNKWVPFTDNCGNKIPIGRAEDDYK